MYIKGSRQPQLTVRSMTFIARTKLDDRREVGIEFVVCAASANQRRCSFSDRDQHRI
jgi:hypothetical protein